jgi:hypothetical protein
MDEINNNNNKRKQNTGYPQLKSGDQHILGEDGTDRTGPHP